jgi:alpha-glucuronidase
LRLLLVAVLLIVSALPQAAGAEDGYRLWLRFDQLSPEQAERHAPYVRSISGDASSPTMALARSELHNGLQGLLGRRVPLVADPAAGSILIGTPRSSRQIAALGLPLARLGREGFVLRSIPTERGPQVIVAANEDIGVLYGVFALLRRLQTNQSLERLDVSESPQLPLRLLNHWDNLDRSVERGYAGASLWDWHKLPGWKDPRYTDYARANASIGMNGTVLTNVNANAEVLTPRYLEKVAALADVFRPWGIRVYLTARFSAPIEIGGLRTADPLDPAVRRWWRGKAAEIYRAVPDFGGFLVKANSEGQPGPQDYGRSHADGANMLADALAPHGGIVMWRAFVYRAASGEDRAKQAYDEFTPLDGKFRRNVILQVKNGPIDFQPREPFHPLFGRMKHTRVMLEAQLTKEYLGFATHLAFLGPMWEEVLDADTHRPRLGTPVARTIGGMAGVANVGTDRNWTGSHFDQANWYAFGRLAWDPALPSAGIAEEWTRMTWGNDPAVVEPVVSTMMRSRQAVVDYMTPLGLHHLMASGHHYGPGPWVDDLERPDWNPVYYHRADRNGIGFDRTVRGSNAVAQYAPELARWLSDPRSTGEDLLLWFHRVPWDYRLSSGRALWEELLTRYDRGLASVAGMRRSWAGLSQRIDAERHAQVSAFLRIQEEEARWWRDASIAYWQSVAQRPLPAGIAPPEHGLATYKAIRFRNVPGDPE